MGKIVGTNFRRRDYGMRKSLAPGLFSGISWLALTIGGGFTPASAATYLVSNETELRNAITSANADGDATATIKMTGSFAISATSLAATTKPITIDTQGFVLSGTDNAAGAGSPISLSGLGGTRTIEGTLVGGDAGAAPVSAAGGFGLGLNFQASVVNNGSITGGTGGGTGGSGASLLNRATLTNNGTISGGAGVGGGGGVGAEIRSGSTVINNGTIQGGDSPTSGGGIGVDIGSPTGNNTLTNNGTIRGGTGPTNGTGGTGGTALSVRTGTNSIVNTGLIEGGSRALAVATSGASTNLNLTNSGTIRAGAGQTDAIRLASTVTSGTINLELQAGSVIEGNVVGNATVTTDTLRLGGSGSDSFDVSTVGTQYQNFDIFEKTGTGTWSLVGDGTAQTNWDIQAGTLAIGNGGTSGSVIGDFTNNGTLAFNRSDSFTFGNLVFGSGSIRQIGSGTTILTADNSAFFGQHLGRGRHAFRQRHSRRHA
jgi:fibronectin-binding autotransporter adhesin